MYILLISRGIPTVREPQWGCFEQDQAEALQKAGHKVVVVSVDSRFLFQWRNLGITHICKNGVIYYNSYWIPGVITNMISGNFNRYVKERQLDRIYKHIEQIHGKPDVIYGQFFFNTALGSFLKNKYSIPLVGIEHAGRFNKDILDSKTKLLASLAYSNTDCIITVSEKLRNGIKRHFNKDSIVVHNLANSIFFNEYIINDKLKNNDIFQFISVGSLVYDKGFDCLIKAMKELKERKINARLYIIGDGPLRNTLQNLIDELDLKGIVTLLGRKTKEELVDLLLESSSFVLSSRNETFGLVYVEAMALGLPVIGTKCGGPEEIIDKHNGILVNVDDINALSQAMEYMYNNYLLYSKKQIANDCRKKYAPSVIAEKLINVFENVLNK